MYRTTVTKPLARQGRANTVMRKVSAKPPTTIQRAINSDIVTTSYFVGKGITLFTFFYTSLNWWMYKQQRKEIEADETDEDNK